MRHTRISTIILMTLLAVAVSASSQNAAPSVNPEINPAVLQVNDDIIYASDISLVMRNIAAQYGSQGQQPPPEEELVQLATQRVVEQKLLSQVGTKAGFEANELAVAERAKEVEQQAGGIEQLNQSLGAMGTNRDHLLDLIREMDIVRTYIKAKISPNIEVTDEEIATFYSENPEMFMAPAQVHARHIIYSAGEDADAETVVNARGNAEEARKRALAGEDFAELAKELSEGPSAPDGGDLGFFVHQQMVPAFADAAFALEVGGISEVVRTNFGFHVIKVEEKIPAGTVPLDEARDDLRGLLTQQKTGQAVTALLKTVAEQSTITPLLAPPAAPPAAQVQPPA